MDRTPELQAAYDQARSDDARARWLRAEGLTDRGEPCHRITAAEGGRTKLYVRGMIGGWRQDADTFIRTVHDLDGPIDLYVNSPGGYVFDAVAMYDALAGHPHPVDVHVDGMAASAASFLVTAGDTVEISRGARMMIHDARGYAGGDAGELRAYADLLDAVSDDIAGFSVARAGGTRDTWRAAMKATTWYSADQAVTAKLADRVATPTRRQTRNTGPDNRTRTILARHRALTTQGG